MRVVDRTETALGGFFADPDTMPGRADDGGRRWSLAAVQREIEFALARQDDQATLRPTAPWDVSGALPYPAIRRLAVVSEAIRRSLPDALGARPGTRYLEGIVAELRRGIDPTPVTLDPGGVVTDPFRLSWVSRQAGEPVRVTTDPLDTDAVLLDSLDSRSVEWAARPTAVPVVEVVVDPLLVQHVGRVSGVIDADLDGSSDPGAERPIYDQAQRLTAVQAIANDLGPREFRRRTGLPLAVAQRAAVGQPISEGNVGKALRALRVTTTDRLCALDDCDEAVTRPNAVYCSSAHKDRAYRQRKRHRSNQSTPTPAQPDPTAVYCRHCDTELMGRAAARGTCSAHKEGR